jgi:hypothetical protein
MALPGLVAARNLADVADRERAWDNLGLSIAFPGTENFDTDAIDYLSRVAIADGSPLEFEVASAINSFVAGCKSDGIWAAIKASCILAGARTLTGALVPLVGAAPTNVNFVSGDYNRKTGLVGDGSTKYLNSNRNNNADPQNSSHNAVFVTASPASNIFTNYIGYGGAGSGVNGISCSNPGTTLVCRCRSINGTTVVDQGLTTGFKGVNRSSSSSYLLRSGGAEVPVTENSLSPRSYTTTIYAYQNNTFHSDARLAFYSIGESLDLALLDARVTTLINAFAAAIP